MLSYIKQKLLLCLLLAFGINIAVSLVLYASDSTVNDSKINDPYEEMNREILDFNLSLRDFTVKPITKGYKHTVPEFIRERVGDFLVFLSTPLNIINLGLQGNMKGAGQETGRLLINATTFGLIDIAKRFDIQPQREDFGQTLARYGVDEGNYLVLPILGPASTRHAVGQIIDFFLNPTSIALSNAGEGHISYYEAFGNAVEYESKFGTSIDSIIEDSLDPYARIRSFYWQNRNKSINNEYR